MKIILAFGSALFLGFAMGMSAPKQATLGVFVTDEAGAPIVKATVYFPSGPRTNDGRVTPANGLAHFGEVRIGDYRLCAMAHGFTEHCADIHHIDARAHTIVLSSERVSYGVLIVDLASGRLIDDAVVVATHQPDRDQRAVMAGQGFARFSLVRTVDFDVCATATGYRQKCLHVPAVDGMVKVIALERAAS